MGVTLVQGCLGGHMLAFVASVLRSAVLSPLLFLLS